jgi:hypothetical protein
MRIAALAALAMITSACSRNDNAAQNRPVATANASDAATRLAALSDRQRNAVFIRAIRDAGLECQHVDWSTPSGSYRGMPVWTAACTRNQVWVIVVGNDGIAQILNPAEGLLIYNEAAGAGRAANVQ